MRESSITKVTRLNIDVEGAGEEQLRKLFEFIALRMVGHQFLRYEFAKVGECDCFVLYFIYGNTVKQTFLFKISQQILSTLFVK